MRRRRHDHTLSLFSFQDIITGVAGVMLFILLLLVVQMSLRTAAAQNDEFGGVMQQTEPEPEPEPPAVDTTDLRKMQQRLEELRRRNADLMQTSIEELETKLKEKSNELDELLDSVDQMKRQTTEMDQQIAAADTDQEKTDAIGQRDALQSQLERLESEKAKHAQGRLIAFRAMHSGVKELWIIDVRGTSTTIFDANSPDEAMSVDYQRYAPSFDMVNDICNRLDEKTKTKNIVLLLRPSIAGVAPDVMSAFQNRGYNVALELLDEDTQVARNETTAK